MTFAVACWYTCMPCSSCGLLLSGYQRQGWGSWTSRESRHTDFWANGYVNWLLNLSKEQFDLWGRFNDNFSEIKC